MDSCTVCGDSGEEARRKLDAAGWTECQISASNSLDEYIIQDLLLQGLQVVDHLPGVGPQPRRALLDGRVRSRRVP